ncbi:hypothetical protein [Subtercola sp. YIM 133946]|uniref:hypothetical protein n=1 Tax=Subtercola sp. YIM 133946 TaxID=3118909 RepID=UPI002F93752A
MMVSNSISHSRRIPLTTRACCAALVLVVSVAMAGCTGAGQSSPESALPSDDTRWQSVLSQVADDGSVTTETALEAFGVAFSPLPGAQTPPGAQTDIESGTLALLWIRQHWQDLTEDQRQAALAAAPDLATTQEVESGSPASVSTTPTARLSAALTDGSDADLTGTEREVGAAFEYFLAQSALTDPGWRPTVSYAPAPEDHVTAEAFPNASGCLIDLNRAEFPQKPLSIQHFVLLHETFHCVEGLAIHGTRVPGAWFREGMALWASSKAPIGPNGPPPDWYYFSLNAPNFWWSYLRVPQRTLFARTYDAYGFFHYLDNRGVDLWHEWATLPSENSAAFLALTGDKTSLTDWPSGFFHDPTLGAAWEMYGVGLPADRAPAATDQMDLANGGSQTFAAQPAAVDVALLNPTADIMTVAFDGVGRLRFADGSEIVNPAASTSYCSRADACACPAGMVSNLGAMSPLPPGLVRLAVTGGVDAGKAVVTGLAFNPDTDCAHPQTSGVWKLSGLSLASADGATVAYAPTGGATTLTVDGDGSAAIDMNSTFAATISGAISSTANVVGTGHTDAHVTFDSAASTMQWATDPGSTGIQLNIDGMSASGASLLGSPGALEPATTMTYSVDGSQQTWTYSIEGGTVTWNWVR